MKASELRIGNYIIDIRTNELQQIKGLDVNYKVNVSGNWEDLSFFSSIGLTEEWIDKFGLSKSNRSSWDSIRFNMDGDRFEIILNKDGEHAVVFEGNNLTWIKSVSELQNLYFALTGEELIVKS